MPQNTAETALKKGTIIKSQHLTYKIESVLGAGSFGITYLASSNIRVGNLTIPIKVAIKEHFISAGCFRRNDGTTVDFLPQTRDMVISSRKDFITEAERLKQLCNKTPNIVKVNETFEANNTAYYVMEYLEGGNPQMMAEEKAVNLVITIANAVALMHKEKILHLDIKPENIVLKREENTTIPVLIDFGIAKHFNQAGQPTSINQAKGATDGYAPIEQYANIDSFSPKYDIYALGALLLTLLSGKRPPRAFDISENLAEIKHLIPPSVSPSTRKAILGAMKRSSKDRTPSVDAFISDLGGCSPTTTSNFINSNKPATPTPPGNSGNTYRGNSTKGLNNTTDNKRRILTISTAVLAIIVACLIFYIFAPGKSSKDTITSSTEDVAKDTVFIDSPRSAPNVSETTDWLIPEPAQETPAAKFIRYNIGDGSINIPEYLQYKGDADGNDLFTDGKTSLYTSFGTGQDLDGAIWFVKNEIGNGYPTYESIKENQYIISGYTYDGEIYYSKGVLDTSINPPVFYDVTLIYPESERGKNNIIINTSIKDFPSLYR